MGRIAGLAHGDDDQARHYLPARSSSMQHSQFVSYLRRADRTLYRLLFDADHADRHQARFVRLSGGNPDALAAWRRAFETRLLTRLQAAPVAFQIMGPGSWPDQRLLIAAVGRV